MFEELIKKALRRFRSSKEFNQGDIYTELIKECKKYFNDQEILMIKKAYLMAKDLHRGQKRKSGEPYIIHPVHVAYILLEELNLHDSSSIVASLLHDTVEDCGITYEFLEKHFGKYIASLIMGVTKIGELKYNTKEEKEAFYNRLLLLSSLKFYCIILIKLADRLHNMRTLEYKEEPKRRFKSAETLRIFVPLANHIGSYIAKEELADLSLKYLNEREYRVIKGMRKDYSLKHQEEIEYELLLFRNMLSNLNITGDVRVSLKSTFAIYQHLTNNYKISEIPNLIRYTIMVDNPSDCEKVADKIRQKYRVLDAYTKDYITSPKPNGYQALHLSIPGYKFTKNKNGEVKIETRRSKITNEYIPIQIQIFTKEMFLVNSYGFAALLDIHPEKTLDEIQEELLKTNPFFKALQENEEIENPLLFLEKTVRELLSDKINVHVADNAIYCLPGASTVLDLAEKIHSELKDEAIGAIVNGAMVNLDFPLKENDHVIILTKNNNLKANLNEEPLNLSLKKPK